MDVLAALRHLFTAGNAHQIQAPFLYQFYQHITKHKNDLAPFANIETLRSNLLLNHNAIQVADYGAGSKVHKTHAVRTLRAITETSSVPPVYGRLLAHSAQFLGATRILEFGTSMGLGALYLNILNPQVEVHSVEGAESIFEQAKAHVAPFQLPNLQIHHMLFDDVFQADWFQKAPFDLFYLDGNHAYEPTLHYFEKVVPHLTPKAVIIIDDIYWSKGMQRAWNQLQQHPKVTLSVDFYRMGFLFTDTALSKQQFRLRYSLY